MCDHTSTTLLKRQLYEDGLTLYKLLKSVITTYCTGNKLI